MARRSRFEGYVNAVKGQAEKPALSASYKVTEPGYGFPSPLFSQSGSCPSIR